MALPASQIQGYECIFHKLRYQNIETLREHHFKCIFNGTMGFAKAIYIDPIPLYIEMEHLHGSSFTMAPQTFLD